MAAVAIALLLQVQEGDVRRYDVPLETLYDAAYQAALAQDLRVDTTTKDAQQGTYSGRSPEGRPFVIRLVRVDDLSTRADVAVEGDPDRSARLHEALRVLTAD